MRLLLLTSLLLGVALCTAQQQEAPRRERLRNLISAARSGDNEARQALQSLRTQLKTRRGGEEGNRRRPSGSSQAQQKEDLAPVEVRTPVQAIPDVVERESFAQEPQQVLTVEPEVQIPDQTPKSTRTGRIQAETPRSFVDHEPHRALNRGLEIDTRSEQNANIHVTNLTKTPPIETIRRFSYFDEAGNYIFGYEAADGSFKEEKRGLDCVVHGKYGYVDPDGVRREFTYTSGNQCDPNAPRNPENQEPDQEPRSQNNQFLVQSQEQKVDEATLNQLQTNRRRQPASRKQEQRVPVSRKPEPQFQPQEAPRRFQPQPVENEQQELQQPIESPAEEIAQPAPRQEIFVEQPAPTPKPVVFRPTIQPFPSEQFNFDQEFKNLFQFANNHFSPAQHKRPDPRPTPVTQAPVRQEQVRREPARQEQQRQEPVIRSESAKPAPTQAPIIPKPVTQAPRNQAHQLVFDAATGAFKTVPLANLVTVAPLPVHRNPPPQQFAAPAQVRIQPPQHLPSRPISSFGANPLPSVPLGSLSFDNNAAREFDNFFTQFHVRPKN